ncbi:hypothetical protein E2C01_004985 [Portunus trituberculatus]|uniref:Uncharacterized protein n=1 Tax=Portunus trituberculatus TaxID=210409 RepID=A0A5B7CTU0_PORTR|nr:hypothetical protein [Portunus trituberculatus]
MCRVLVLAFPTVASLTVLLPLRLLQLSILHTHLPSYIQKDRNATVSHLLSIGTVVLRAHLEGVTSVGMVTMASPNAGLVAYQGGHFVKLFIVHITITIQIKHTESNFKIVIFRMVIAFNTQLKKKMLNIHPILHTAGKSKIKTIPNGITSPTPYTPILKRQQTKPTKSKAQMKHNLGNNTLQFIKPETCDTGKERNYVK